MTNESTDQENMSKKDENLDTNDLPDVDSIEFGLFMIDLLKKYPTSDEREKAIDEFIELTQELGI